SARARVAGELVPRRGCPRQTLAPFAQAMPSDRQLNRQRRRRIMANTTNQLQEQLSQFSGSELFYRHPLNRKLVYTEGVRFLAEKAEAFWLIDAIASYFGSPEMDHSIALDERLESMEFWHLQVNDVGNAKLTARADKDVVPFIVQSLPFTDFPLPEFDIWAGFNGEFWTLYLPSEH